MARLRESNSCLTSPLINQLGPRAERGTHPASPLLLFWSATPSRRRLLCAPGPCGVASPAGRQRLHLSGRALFCLGSGFLRRGAWQHSLQPLCLPGRGASRPALRTLGLCSIMVWPLFYGQGSRLSRGCHLLGPKASRWQCWASAPPCLPVQGVPLPSAECHPVPPMGQAHRADEGSTRQAGRMPTASLRFPAWG